MSGLKQTNLHKTGLQSNSSDTHVNNDMSLTDLANILTTKVTGKWMKLDDEEDNIPLVQLQLKRREEEEMRDQEEDMAN